MASQRSPSPSRRRTASSSGVPTPLLDATMYAVCTCTAAAICQRRERAATPQRSNPQAARYVLTPVRPPLSLAVRPSRPTRLQAQAGALNVYHRSKFSRAQARDGRLQPLFVAAVYAAPDQMPPILVLRRLSEQCAPTPLRCACAWQHQVLLFEVGFAPAPRQVHTPDDIGAPARTVQSAAAPLAASNHDSSTQGALGGRSVEAQAPPAADNGSASSRVPPTGGARTTMPSRHHRFAGLPSASPTFATRMPSPPPSPPSVYASYANAGGGMVITGEDDEEDELDEADGARTAPSPSLPPAGFVGSVPACSAHKLAAAGGSAAGRTIVDRNASPDGMANVDVPTSTSGASACLSSACLPAACEPTPIQPSLPRAPELCGGARRRYKHADGIGRDRVIVVVVVASTCTITLGVFWC